MTESKPANNPLTELQQLTLQAVRNRTKKSPITGKQIAQAIGLKPRSSGKEGADMRSIIHALRCKGYPICATGSGYWWPASQHELSTYIGSLQNRIAEQAKALAGLQWSGAEKLDMAIGGGIPNATYRYLVANENRIYSVPADRLEEFKAKYPKAKRV